MSKYLMHNTFHNRSAIITIRDAEKYEHLAGLGLDDSVMIGLHSSGFSDNDTYARRKLAEIKARLCGSPNCMCGACITTSII